jgi:tRNA-Thr(GGU) m(6)t(6)A37 methyltransferase TsaA
MLKKQNKPKVLSSVIFYPSSDHDQLQTKSLRALRAFAVKSFFQQTTNDEPPTARNATQSPLAKGNRRRYPKTMTFTFEPIGVVRTCFTDKFGIPRQSGLVPEARGEIELFPPYASAEAVRELTSFSHLWVAFVFHGNPEGRWSPTVRPPRLGGNRRIGVFASRSGFRPNPIGLSAVRIEGIRHDGAVCRIGISGADLLDGTPVLDIKPYLPYADRIEDATGGIADKAPGKRLSVVFSPGARKSARRMEAENGIDLFGLIEAMLALDPRPAYQESKSERIYGFILHGADVRWQVRGTEARVLTIRTGPYGFDQTEEKR